MTERSLPWNGIVTGDCGPYSDADWQRLWQYIIGLGGQRANVGVFLGSSEPADPPNEGLSVVAQNPVTTSVNVLSGAALIQGIAYINDDTESFVISANASGNPRIDTIVLQADYAQQTIRLVVSEGAPAASPTPPTMTQTPGVMWEIPIADIAVANGFSSISQSNITSRREWVNAASGVYLDNVFNNSGDVLEDGDVVVWDSTTNRAVTTTTTQDNKAVAGVWVGRAEASEYGRVLIKGIGYVRTTGAVTRGNILATSTTAKQATNLTGIDNAYLARALETTSGAGLALCFVDVHTVRDTEYILIRDEKTSGSAGAAITSGGWRTRELNTEVQDTGSFASVASNQITLAAGNYKVIAMAPVGSAITSRARLRNVTDGATLVEGINVLSGFSQVVGNFTLTAQKVLELQQWVSVNTTGGLALSTGETEKYASVYLERNTETA